MFSLEGDRAWINFKGTNVELPLAALEGDPDNTNRGNRFSRRFERDVMSLLVQYEVLSSSVNQEMGCTRTEYRVKIEAAAIPYGGLLALHFLKEGGVAPGMRVLIYGASGATGTSAVQLAKHFGAHVTGVCSAGNLELVRSLGADAVIDYTSQDFTTRGERYDLIFAAVGGRYHPPSEEECRRVLAPGGAYVTVDGWNPKMTRERLAQLRDLAEAGTLRAVIDRCYPLAEMAEAHRYVETQRKRGNVVTDVP
jgi:NADPH:quinone reductase-like Zn-dependent oxidoreductase